MPPQKRKSASSGGGSASSSSPTYNFFLRPQAAAELAAALVGISNVIDRFSIDLTSEELSIEGVDSCMVCMVYFRAQMSAFATFEVERPTHLVIGSDVMKLVFRGATSDFVFYQKTSDPDHVVFEKVDTGVKMTVGLLDVEVESLAVRIASVEARHSYESGRELAAAFSDLVATMKAGSGDVVEFETASTKNGSAWFVRHSGEIVQFSQHLKTGTSMVHVPQKMILPRSHIIMLLHLVTIAKGPSELRFIDSGNGTLFSLHAEATDGEFGFDMFVAPKISNDD